MEIFNEFWNVNEVFVHLILSPQNVRIDSLECLSVFRLVSTQHETNPQIVEKKTVWIELDWRKDQVAAIQIH